VPYGRVGDGRDLAGIWAGPERVRLRDALDEGDFSIGCQDCGADHALGHRLQTHAEAYDRFPQPSAAPAWPTRVEFALSNTCNLQCVHCNGDLSSAIRAQREHRPALVSRYDDAFFEELRELLPHVEVAVFIGGEPFLARECRRVWDLLIEMDLHPEVHVTTNATVWDDRVEHYVRALRMNVAVSIDGATAEVNDAIRLGSELAEVHAIRDRLLAATRSYGGSFTLNHCLLRQNWHELADFLLDAEELGVASHVIPVFYPPAMSIFHLGEDELAAVLAGLEAEAPRVADLERNRGAWDAAVAHVADHLNRLGRAQESPVRLRVRAAVEDDVVAAVRAELRDWSGQEPLVIALDGTGIAAVDEPAWAGWMDAPSFVGRRLAELETAGIERLGPRRNEREERDPSGMIRLSYEARIDGRDVPFRAVVVPPWHVLTSTPERLELLLGGDPGGPPA
jgi:molybdenum cofactor biosynthesis enzyme MoaA